MYKKAVSAGAHKASSPLSDTIILGVLAGIYIAMGGSLSLTIANLPATAAVNPGFAKFAFGAVFPLGLVLVMLNGADLFTSNCATVAAAALQGRCAWWQLVRNWTVVWLSNLAGSLLFAALIHGGLGVGLLGCGAGGWTLGHSVVGR